MIQTITNCDFHDAFTKMDRGDNFTYEGLNVLYDYLERLEEDTGEPYDLDVIALCGEYSESTLEELNNEYDQTFDDLDEAERWLSRKTTVVGRTSSSILFAVF